MRKRAVRPVIRGVLLDKDGTIVDIDKTWVPVARLVVEEIVSRYGARGLQEELLEAIGIRAGVVDPDGSMARGTNQGIARDFLEVLARHGTAVLEDELAVFSRACFDDYCAKVTIYPTVEDLAGLLERIRSGPRALGLATADTLVSAENCLRQLGVREMFDFVGADDGVITPKPHPDLLHEFCRVCGLEPGEVVMVGDTTADVELGRRGGAGMVIGIAPEGTRVARMADIRLDSVTEIVDATGTPVWESRE